MLDMRCLHLWNVNFLLKMCFKAVLVSHFFFFPAENLVAFSWGTDEKSPVLFLSKIWKLVYCYTMARLHHLTLYSRAPLMPNDFPLLQSQVTTWICRKVKMKLLNVKWVIDHPSCMNYGAGECKTVDPMIRSMKQFWNEGVSLYRTLELGSRTVSWFTMFNLRSY